MTIDTYIVNEFIKYYYLNISRKVNGACFVCMLLLVCSVVTTQKSTVKYTR